MLRTITSAAKFIKSTVKLNYSVIGFGDKNIEIVVKISKQIDENKQK